MCLFSIYISFQAVQSVMQQRNVSVNVQTFGCLALGCEQQKDGLQLLEDMEVISFFAGGIRQGQVLLTTWGHHSRATSPRGEEKTKCHLNHFKPPEG